MRYWLILYLLSLEPIIPLPVTDLDAEISNILSSLPDAIDNAIEVQEAAIRFKVFKRKTQGWSILVGSWLDFYSDIVINNRTLSNLGGLTTVYRNGFIVFYGIGFGFPYLLGMPNSVLQCSSADFNDVLKQYQLTNGLQDLFASNLSLSIISSVISEYDTIVRIRLNCILQFESNIIEAEEIVFALDELKVLLDLRLACEKDRRTPASTPCPEGTTTSPDSKTIVDTPESTTEAPSVTATPAVPVIETTISATPVEPTQTDPVPMVSGNINGNLEFTETADFSATTTITPLEASTLAMADSTIVATTSTEPIVPKIPSEASTLATADSTIVATISTEPIVPQIPLEASTLALSDSTIAKTTFTEPIVPQISLEASTFAMSDSTITTTTSTETIVPQINVGGKNESLQSTDFATLTTVTPLESSTLVMANATVSASTSSSAISESTLTTSPTIGPTLGGTNSVFTTSAPDVAADIKTTLVSEVPKLASENSETI